MKKYLISTTIFDRLEDLELEADEKYLFLFLTHNKGISVSGIYECRKRDMMSGTGIDKTRIHDCVNNLVLKKLIYFDNNVIFIPEVPEEQTIEGKKGWTTNLLKAREYFSKVKSDSGNEDDENRAFSAFLQHHEERFFQIDEDIKYQESIAGGQEKKKGSLKHPSKISENDEAASGSNKENTENDEAAQSSYTENAENNEAASSSLEENSTNDEAASSPPIRTKNKEIRTKKESINIPYNTLEDRGAGIFANRGLPPPTSTGETEHERIKRLVEERERTYPAGALGGPTAPGMPSG